MLVSVNTAKALKQWEQVRPCQPFRQDLCQLPTYLNKFFSPSMYTTGVYLALQMNNGLKNTGVLSSAGADRGSPRSCASVGSFMICLQDGLSLLASTATIPNATQVAHLSYTSCRKVSSYRESVGSCFAGPLVFMSIKRTRGRSCLRASRQCVRRELLSLGLPPILCLYSQYLIHTLWLMWILHLSRSLDDSI